MPSDPASTDAPAVRQKGPAGDPLLTDEERSELLLGLMEHARKGDRTAATFLIGYDQDARAGAPRGGGKKDAPADGRKKRVRTATVLDEIAQRRAGRAKA